LRCVAFLLAVGCGCVFDETVLTMPLISCTFLFPYNHQTLTTAWSRRTNHLDMESIDALASAINEYKGGMVLVSHDMRLISQVANEIWICDNKTITKYQGDIQNFKMDMRAQMGIENNTSNLRGDASVLKKDDEAAAPAKKKATTTAKTVSKTPAKKKDDDTATTASVATASSMGSKDEAASTKSKYVPPHLRKKMSS
jgi:ABC-type multidrug transport system ATPase subunit